MKKSKIFSFTLLCILVMAVLAAPVSGGLTVTDGDPITTTDGITSPFITVTDADIPDGGTITIDVSGLNTYIASPPLTDANVEIWSDSAATWTRVVNGDGTLLTLTWEGAYTLQSAALVGGPYADVANASSGYQVDISTGAQFFRLRE